MTSLHSFSQLPQNQDQLHIDMTYTIACLLLYYSFAQ